MGWLVYGQAFQSREPDCGRGDGAGQASIFGRNGLLRAFGVALPGGRGRQAGHARAGGQEQAQPARRRTQASGDGGVLQGDALVDLERRDLLEQRINGGIVLGAGDLPQPRAAGGCDPCRL